MIFNVCIKADDIYKILQKLLKQGLAFQIVS